MDIIRKAPRYQLITLMGVLMDNEHTRILTVDTASQFQGLKFDEEVIAMMTELATVTDDPVHVITFNLITDKELHALTKTLGVQAIEERVAQEEAYRSGIDLHVVVLTDAMTYLPQSSFDTITSIFAEVDEAQVLAKDVTLSPSVMIEENNYSAVFYQSLETTLKPIGCTFDFLYTYETLATQYKAVSYSTHR